MLYAATTQLHETEILHQSYVHCEYTLQDSLLADC